MKTVQEINEKIKQGTAVVMTAEEVIAAVKESGIAETAKKVDVVTTGTFGPMCSSGCILNFGHTEPLMRMSQISLNDVPCYAGLAAVDCFLGATELSTTEGMNYGGANVIEDLIAGKDVHLKAKSYGTDCYPRLDYEGDVRLADMNQCIMFNPRNAYQNYSAVANTSDKTIRTYMGTLLPNCRNVTYSTSGELSPLLKDPEMRTIGIGTRVFFGGTQGYVAWEGTQCFPSISTDEDGCEHIGGGTLALIGDMKKMSTDFIRAARVDGYGISMFVGVGIPFPVLDEAMLERLAVSNEDLYTEVYDYSVPTRSRPMLKKRVSYAELRSGSIELNGRTVPTAPMSSLKKAREIAALLKQQILDGEFLLTEPVAPLDMNTKKKGLQG